MLLIKSMTRKVITIDENADILKARAKMAAHGIRHLPVVEKDNHLIGIVTDRDIRSALPFEIFKDVREAEYLENISKCKIKEIMTREPHTVSSSQTIQDALLLFQKTRVGAFPVIDEQKRIIGIISDSDILRAFIHVLGIGKPGTLLGIVVEEKLSHMKKILNAIIEENISFGSILVSTNWQNGKRAVFPYLFTQNTIKLKKKLQNLGFELLDPMEWNIDKRNKGPGNK